MRTLSRLTLVTSFLSGTTSFLLLPNTPERTKPRHPPPRLVVRLSPTTTPSTSSTDDTPEQDDISVMPMPRFDYQKPLPESEYTQVLTSHLPRIAQEIRDHWDRQFADPRQPDATRFSWDPWYVEVGHGKFGTVPETDNDDNKLQPAAVEGEQEATNRQIQYSLKRTMTSSFLDHGDNTNDGGDQHGRLYDRLVDQLVSLGTSVGLTAITPPWMSLYTEGDLQNFHTDAPHGPLAFVLSLCQDGEFSGGETILLQPQILHYWRDFDGSNGLECGSIVRYIPPTPLGRCIAFDPRVPHGVNRVSGSQDPRKGRVVIHGWFNEPETCWFGPWDDTEQGEDRMKRLDSTLQPLVETLGTGEIGRVMGYLAVRLDIDADGQVEEVYAVCDTLQADWDDFRGIIGYDEADRPVMEDAGSDVRLTAFEALQELSFEPGSEGRSVVVPFLFE